MSLESNEPLAPLGRLAVYWGNAAECNPALMILTD